MFAFIDWTVELFPQYVKWPAAIGNKDADEIAKLLRVGLDNPEWSNLNQIHLLKI